MNKLMIDDMCMWVTIMGFEALPTLPMEDVYVSCVLHGCLTWLHVITLCYIIFLKIWIGVDLSVLCPVLVDTLMEGVRDTNTDMSTLIKFWGNDIIICNQHVLVLCQCRALTHVGYQDTPSIISVGAIECSSTTHVIRFN